MRIRKRKVPFSLSSLSPVLVSSSDPHLTTSSVEQLQHPHLNFSQELDRDLRYDAADDKASFVAGSNDQQVNDNYNNNNNNNNNNNSLIRTGDRDLPGFGAWKKKDEENKVLLKGGGEENGEEREKSNDTRRGSFFLGAKTPATVFKDSTSSSHQADERWCEEEKAFPFKKRRGNLERRSSNEEETVVVPLEKDKKTKAKMKTKMNKKCMQRNSSNEEQQGDKKEDNEDHNKAIERSSSNSSTKKKVRGGALMEGSRCSRVNGRGWRCCQQTLVGYSLCEHHLGKGRLRSMTSVRSRSMASSTAPKKLGESQPLQSSATPFSHEEEERKKNISLDDKAENVHGDNEEEEKHSSLVAKKRQKLGSVKARSMSSLLGQTNNAIDEVAEN